MRVGQKKGLLASAFLFLAVVGAGFWAWSWRQRKNAPFACPVAWSYCRRAKMARLPGGDAALGFAVPEGTAVLAAAGGLVKQSAYRREDGKIEQTIILELKGGGRFVYAFTGQALVQMQDVALGQPIGRIEDEGEAVKNTGANLVVYFRNQEGQIEAVNRKDFRPLK